MSSFTDCELSEALTWTENSYTLSELVNEFPLPQVVRVVRGYDGGTEMSTIGYGEVLTLHALRETRALAGEDRNGNAISVALDYPKEFQLLPQVKDCILSSCGVTKLASVFPTVKYVEVIEAHYGTRVDLDSADLGEILEILDIDKPHKPDKMKVKVRNLERNQTAVLTSNCTAQFRPLLDWKTCKAADLKLHKFGFPVRVRFMEDNVVTDADMECQRLIAKSPDINVLKEIEHVVVICTTIESCPDMKSCCEIPKEVEIKVAVAEGFSTEAKHYTAIVKDLDDRFNVTKFMASHQPALVMPRHVIKKYKYESIKDYLIGDPLRSQSSDDKPEISGAPALPPRYNKVSKTKSVELPGTAPDVQCKPRPRKKSLPSIPGIPSKPGPPVSTRPRAKTHDCAPKVRHDGETMTPGVQDGTEIDNSPASAPDVIQETDSIPGTSPDVPPVATDIPPVTTDTPPVTTDIPPVTTDIPPVTTDIPNGSTIAKPKRPPRPARRDDSSTSDQENKMTESPQTPSNETNTPVKSPNVPVATGSDPPSHPDYPSKVEDEDIAKREPEVQSPKLPPRRLNREMPSNPAGATSEVPRAAGQTKPGDQSPLNQAYEQDTYVPKLPPKSPGRVKKFPANARQVLPVSPNGPPVPLKRHPRPPTASHQPSTLPAVSPKPPFTPPCPRNPSISKALQRSGTLPMNFKLGERDTNEADSSIYVEPETDDIYEEPLDIHRVMPVAPQPILSGPQYTHEENPYELVAKIPRDLSGLSIADVGRILKNLNMGQYAERFEHEMVDGDLLKMLKDEELESFEMQKLHRTKLLNFINGWRPTYQTRKPAS